MKKHNIILALSAMLAVIFALSSCSGTAKTPVIDDATHVYTSLDIAETADIAHAYNFFVNNTLMYAVCLENTDEEFVYSTKLYSFTLDGAFVAAQTIPGVFAPQTADFLMVENGVTTVLSDNVYGEYIPGQLTPMRTVNLTDFVGDGVRVSVAAIDGAGNFYFASGSKVTALSSHDLSVLSEITLSGDVEKLTRASDGTVIAKFTSGGVSSFERLDGGGSLGSMNLPANVDVTNGADIYFGSGDAHDGYEMYIADSVGLYGFNAADAEATLLVNWKNSFISGRTVTDLIVLSPEKMMYMYQNQVTGKTCLSMLTKRADGEEGSGKYVVSLGYYQTFDDHIEFIVNEFNRNNDKYKVVINDYSAYNTPEDSAAGKVALDNEIAAGNAPDIVSHANYDYVRNFAEKGLFADLYTFMKSDGDLTADSLLSAATAPFEIGGKLYTVPTRFSVSALSGKSALIPEDGTVTGIIDLAKSLSAGKALIKNQTRGVTANLLFKIGYDTFIDYEKATCNFDSAEFIEVIEYLKSLPETADRSLYDSPEKEIASYQNGNILLQQSRVGSVSDYVNQKFIFAQEGVSYIGYPSSSGGAGVVQPYDCYGITKDSPVKDGAWEFVKFMLSDEIQASVQEMNPVTADVFESLLQTEADKIYYCLYSGGMISHPGDHVPDAEMYRQNYGDGEFITVTDDDIAKIKALVNADSAVYEKDKPVLDIINEELESYFNGSKSADETAKVIQSRAAQYISETYK